MLDPSPWRWFPPRGFSPSTYCWSLPAAVDVDGSDSRLVLRAFAIWGSGVGAGCAEALSLDGPACCMGSIAVIAAVEEYPASKLYLAGSSSSCADNTVPGTHGLKTRAVDTQMLIIPGKTSSRRSEVVLVVLREGTCTCVKERGRKSPSSPVQLVQRSSLCKLQWRAPGPGGGGPNRGPPVRIRLSLWTNILVPRTYKYLFT